MEYFCTFLRNETDTQPLLTNQILLRLIGIFNRTMRKNFQRQPQAPFLPSITTTTSRKDLQTKVSNSCKENQNVQTSKGSKFKFEPAHCCLAKKDNFINTGSPFEEVLNKKLLQKQKMDIPTQPKANRPWIARQLQMNKLATRTSRLQPLQLKNESDASLRRKSCHYNQSSSRQSQYRATTIDKTIKLPRNINIRSKSLARDKINSCKIAMKKGIFPMDQKRYEHEKMLEYFQQDSAISTIFDKQSTDQGQFISFQSYKQIQF